MTITIIGGFDPAPFDIRQCPVWAIPQLASFKRLCTSFGVDVEFFEFRHGGGIGLVTVGVAGVGIFCYGITKWDMNEHWVPELAPATPPTRELKVGDRVRHSKNYIIEGVIKEINPCDMRDCNEMLLTLDPSGQDSTGMGRTRWYYHASSFELVTSE